MRRLALLAALALAFAAPSAAGAEPERWAALGPHAPVIGLLEVDPADPATLYGASGTGLYRSRDGGGSWERLPGLPAGMCCAWVIEADPGAPGTVYVVAASPFGSALLRSTDRGETWRSLGLTDVGAFALVPGAPSALLAASYEQGPLRSLDGGATWEASSEGLGENACCVAWIAPSPAAPATVYALAGDRLYRSLDRGERWEQRTLPGREGEFYPAARALDPSDAATLYLADGFGNLLRTVDGGGSWGTYGAPVPIAGDGYLIGLTAVATEPTTIYAVTDRGLYRRTGAAAGWTRLDVPLTAGTFAAPVADPSDPERLYWATAGGLLVTSDGAATWHVSSTGLPNLPAQSVAAGPDGRIYAGLPWGGVVSTTDGAAWSVGTGGAIEGETVLSLLTDPTTGRVLAGTYNGRVLRSDDGGATWAGETAGLPYASVWALSGGGGPRLVLAATELGVYRSADGGERWRRSSRDLPNTGVRAVSSAPSRPALVYAGLDRGGVWRSRDGGRSWLPSGLGRLTVLALAVDPADPRLVYAATDRSGAYRSDDGGRTWERVAATRRTASLAIDPSAPQTVLLGTGGTILRSRDRGRSWQPLVDGLPSRGGLPFDPEASAPRLVLGLAAVPGGAYAATWSGVFSIRFGEEAP